jgi:hypothetical protein
MNKDEKITIAALLVFGVAVTLIGEVLKNVEKHRARLKAMQCASEAIRENINLGYYSHVDNADLPETIEIDYKFYTMMYLASES